MPRIKVTARCLLFSGFIGLGISSMGALAETIRFATIDYCPFACRPIQEGGKEGLMTEVLREAFQGSGYELEFSMLPYVRAVKYVKEGRYDGIVAVGKKYAPGLTYPDQPTVLQRVVFLTNSDTYWSYSGVASLENERLGIVRGFHYVDDDLVNYIYREKKNPDRVYEIHGDKTTERAIGMLRSDRFTVFIEGEHSAHYELKKKGISHEVRVAGYTSEAFEVYSAFNSQNSESRKYAEMLSNTLEKLKQSGELFEILHRYGISSELHEH